MKVLVLGVCVRVIPVGVLVEFLFFRFLHFS